MQCESEFKELSVLDCHCITYHYTSTGEKTVSVIGSCFFNSCDNHTGHSSVVYHRAPSNCRYWNREGTLCEKCHEGHALPAYSYDLRCMQCDSEHQNWGLYVVYAFLPLTVFIGIILLFQINVVHPKLFVFIFAAQNIAIPINIRYFVSRA